MVFTIFKIFRLVFLRKLFLLQGVFECMKLAQTFVAYTLFSLNKWRKSDLAIISKRILEIWSGILYL